MNERIRELAEQTFYYGNWEGDGIYTGQLDLEKFAELIVKECIVMADDFECDVNQRGLVDQMKQHFGVK
ncbi:hypothetical protein UFOVP1146_186 [uncultured Caudovirales phage]|uniref:Uncharacterized protein n=1 Tax=uncultured Caudovirales phage TaxID=2100421 RepID=A0A6J5T2Y9_9CAUD|nr:hypothetical protein UFOVP812_99 [uncultured Caudovirales phage]CAB4165487.1 hypothetical protein UFOVP818_44 [uncultured Caudovirales phage]CAB4186840.1 hypothetical protein UFOVP1146_186 [uncultured Caudovirales phage]CAB4221556.1 hypothetical protein UFOVP1638_379 [uncultured Caudovirales phage]